MFVNFSVLKGDMWSKFNNLQSIGACLALYFCHGKHVLKLVRKKGTPGSNGLFKSKRY